MQQITRGDYLKDLITIYIENNLQTDITELYSQFIFQCGEIQKTFTPAQVIKISFSEQESLKLKNLNTCYLAGITVEGHKETFNGSLTFNTRGEVVNYEPTVSGSVTVNGTTANDCGCQGLRGVYSNCCQPAIKAYFSLNYVPTKLSELTNDTDFVDSVDVAESISIHNTSTEAHPYIQGLIENEESVRASQTEALHQSILAEATAREEAVSLAISTTEGYADTQISNHNSSEQAHPYIQSALVSATEAINVTIGDLDNLDTANKSSVVNAINSEVTARENADNNLQTQIDALAAASDVTDIVGTYQELQNYDTQHLNDNDIIKVLSDSTHQDQPSYYRFDKDTDSFTYIGSEDAGYTKAQADAKFVTQTTTVNGKALSSDISLTYSDVNALSDTYATTIAGNTSAIASNTSVIAQHTTAIASNTSDISTINGKIPTDASSSNKLVSASTLAASIADFANQDLANLTNNGEARLHALKSYADNGELLTDPDGLAFVEKYAHSTFDASKFTVVGSPNITDDGLATFNSTSNINTGITLELQQGQTFKIKQRWIVTEEAIQGAGTSSGIQQWLNFNTSNATATMGLLNITQFHWLRQYIPVHDFVNNTDLNVHIDFQDGNQKPYNPSVNDVVDYEFYYDTTNYFQARFRINGGQWMYGVASKDGGGLAMENYTLKNTVALSINRTNSNYTRNIHDLKMFYVEVDGVPVFSGNKTGIDTIKPVDFTARTSSASSPFVNPSLPWSDDGLTISADGIASGFGIMIGLEKTDLSFSPTQSLKIRFKFKTSSIISSEHSQRILTLRDVSNSNYGISFQIMSNGNYRLRVTGNGYDSANYLSVLANTLYYTELEFIGTKYVGRLSTDGINWTTVDINTNNLFTVSSTVILNIGALLNNNDANPFTGSVDLNSIEIYIDGNLVYQPCLKIPYTESKTGSKIVDAIYRDRVNDMAEQFGFANYYTLSDTDFTLPQVELYGLIGQRTLRDSYRNGINYWELYSNRDLEQGGSCTSGVEVTFARPFADTNYVLSVPYSAKSTTAFTPTQTGDWIAKGKGLL